VFKLKFHRPPFTERIIAMGLNFFRLPLIKHRKVTIGFTHCAQKLIEFCVYRLGIAVFGPLDEQRHDPCRDGGGALPTKRPWIENQPHGHVYGHNNESERMGR
jgi:hypothetical protein